MLQTWSDNSIDACKAWASWLILDISLMMMIICLGHICLLVLHLTLCRYLDDLHSTRLPHTQIMSNLVIDQVSSPLGCWVQGTNSTYPFWHLIHLVFHSCHLGYPRVFPCLPNPCRKMNYTSRNGAPTSHSMSTYIELTYMSKASTSPRYVLHTFKKLYSKSWVQAAS